MTALDNVMFDHRIKHQTPIRSLEYWNGFRAGLAERVENKAPAKNPEFPGVTHYDAWEYGQSQGRAAGEAWFVAQPMTAEEEALESLERR
jgi:hypothetical protein